MTIHSRLLAFALAALCGTIARGQPAVEQATATPSSVAQPADTPTQGELDQQFAQRLSGSVLEGTYTIVGADQPGETKPDRYEISRVSKLGENLWLFQAKYGEQILPPLPLKVLWAGQTPIITMDDFTIPGLGTFSFRVMIDRDLYAGTWKHDEKGGHMTGTVKKEKNAKPPAP